MSNRAARVIVTGGRKYADKSAVYDALDTAHRLRPIGTLVHGGASGADELAASWALDNDVVPEPHKASWTILGRSAGPIRNREMARAGADLLIAFPGGDGTSDMISAAKSYGIPVLRVEAI